MPPPDDQRTDERPPGAAVPPGPAAPGPVTAPAEPATQRRAVAALLLSLLSLAGLLSLNYLQRGIYLVAYALLAGVIAMFLAVTSLTRARRRRTARPRGSVTATVIAAVGIVLSMVMLLAFVVFGPQLKAYGRCLGAATTGADQQACQTQFIHAVNRELTTFRATGSR
jgi:amino acid transporter